MFIMSLTPKISHHCVSVFIQQNIVAVKITCCGATCYFSPSITSHTKPGNCAHLLRSLWMMGWVRLCRYSIPLATSMAMMSLDCMSMSLSIDTSLKPQLDQWTLPITQAASHRSIRRSIKMPNGPTVNATLGLDRCWQEEKLVRRHLREGRWSVQQGCHPTDILMKQGKVKICFLTSSVHVAERTMSLQRHTGSRWQTGWGHPNRPPQTG